MGEVPSDDAVRRVVEDGPWSVTKFWLENVTGLALETTWFLPVVEISPDRTPLEDGRIPRSRLIDAAVSAASVERGLAGEL